MAKHHPHRGVEPEKALEPRKSSPPVRTVQLPKAGFLSESKSPVLGVIQSLALCLLGEHVAKATQTQAGGSEVRQPNHCTPTAEHVIM